MRFSSSLVAFAYLGFAAAAILPVVPTEPTTIASTTHHPERTPDLSGRDGPKLPGTPSKGGQKYDNIARRDRLLPRSFSIPTGTPTSAPVGVPSRAPTLPGSFSILTGTPTSVPVGVPTGIPTLPIPVPSLAV